MTTDRQQASEPPERFLLALDIGTRTGWAVRSPRGVVASGQWGLQAARGDGPGMRLVHFRQRLHEVQAAYPLALVAYEEVRRHAGTHAAHVYGALEGLLQEWCEVRKVPYYGLTVGQIKKAATGKGNAKKAAMIEAAVRRWPDRYPDPGDWSDDEADACWIAELAYSQCSQELQ